MGGANRWGKPVSIAVSGTDTRKIKEATSYLVNELKKKPELKDIADNGGIGKREV